MTDNPPGKSTARVLCVYTPRPTVAPAAPVVVIILVLAQLFSRVEFSLILGR